MQFKNINDIKFFELKEFCKTIVYQHITLLINLLALLFISHNFDNSTIAIEIKINPNCCL